MGTTQTLHTDTNSHQFLFRGRTSLDVAVERTWPAESSREAVFVRFDPTNRGRILIAPFPRKRGPRSVTAGSHRVQRSLSKTHWHESTLFRRRIRSCTSRNATTANRRRPAGQLRCRRRCEIATCMTDRVDVTEALFRGSGLVIFSVCWDCGRVPGRIGGTISYAVHALRGDVARYLIRIGRTRPSSWPIV